MGIPLPHNVVPFRLLIFNVIVVIFFLYILVYKIVFLSIFNFYHKDSTKFSISKFILIYFEIIFHLLVYKKLCIFFIFNIQFSVYINLNKYLLDIPFIENFCNILIHDEAVDFLLRNNNFETFLKYLNRTKTLKIILDDA